MYILATHFADYWLKYNGREAKYPKFMLRFQSLPQDNIHSVFIQLNEDQSQTIRGWSGYIHGIRTEQDHLHFTPVLSKELESSELDIFQGFKSGWYSKDGDISAEDYTDYSTELTPLFFKTLLGTTIPTEFEDAVYLLVRLLGIHKTYKFPPMDQAGRADGFFKFAHLAVIYDCTLRNDFETFKEQQIENFCNLMLEGVIQADENTTERVARHYKQVWIITRRQSRTLKTIGDFGHVLVKEVAVQDLIRLYFLRIHESIHEDELEARLRMIGQSELD